MRDVKEVEVRRAEIMSAALQLFAQKGYLKTRTQDIIDKLGISRGLLYYHFKAREKKTQPGLFFNLRLRKASKPLRERV